MDIVGPADERFEQALADAQGWPRAYADEVAREYRRFLYLAAASGCELTPSLHVDEAWHLHLTWPHYDEVLCGEILRRPLDHRPGTGGTEDEERFRRQYEETLALYRAEFGPAPREIWPQPHADESERSFGALFWSLLGAAVAVAAGVGVFDSAIDGVLVALPLGVPFAIYALVRSGAQFVTADRGGAGCGGAFPFIFSADSGGADSGSCGSACGASCGSSCGGGCGGGGD